MTIQDFIIERIKNLPDYPSFLIDVEWNLENNVPYPWDGFDFTTSIYNNDYILQLSFYGRVLIYDSTSKIIFASQI